MRTYLACLISAVLLIAAPLPLPAQGLFAPAAKVNDSVVTRYEVQQRARLLRLLRAPGNLQKLALEQLIEERLKAAEAKRLGITVPEEQVIAGQEQFASRAGLSRAQVIRILGQAGVSPQTFRDFVQNQLAWREVVRARFGPRVTVTEQEIDRAIAKSGNNQAATGGSGPQVLLAEIYLPAGNARTRAASRARASEIARIRTIPEFSEAARRFSTRPSAERGGELNWTPEATLPKAIRPAIARLQVGEVAGPFDFDDAIAFFQLRGRRQGARDGEALDYMMYFIPGGRSEKALKEAAKIRARADTCEDLYGIARKQPPERLRRETLPAGQVPGRIAAELARMDDNEVSTALTSEDGSLIFLMLCARTTVAADVVNRDVIRNQIRNERLSSYANSYLAELKSDAVIERP